MKSVDRNRYIGYRLLRYWLPEVVFAAAARTEQSSTGTTIGSTLLLSLLLRASRCSATMEKTIAACVAYLVTDFSS